MKYICIALLLIVVSSCAKELSSSPTEHFDVVKKIKPIKEIDLGEYDILRPTALLKYKDWYVFEDVSEGKSFKFLNMKTHKVNEAIDKGRGPFDIVGVCRTTIIDDSLCVFDFNQQKILVLDVDGDSVYVRKKNTKVQLEPACFIDENRFIEVGVFYDSCMYRMINKDGEVISRIPYPKNVSLSEFERHPQNSIYMNTVFAASPDKTKYAFGVMYVQMMGFGEIKGDSLTLDKVYEYAPISIAELVPGDGYTRILPAKDNIKNAITAFGTEEYVFFVYSGSRYDDYDALGSCYLIYKWDGTPYMRLDVDDNVFETIYDKERNVLICLSYAPEAKLVEYDMTGIIDVD